MFSLEPIATVVSFPKVNPILEQVGEGTVGEGYAPSIFFDL
jgi:hypothetical protein